MQREKIGHNSWNNFLDFVKPRTSQTAFENWLAPIHVVEAQESSLHLEVPNVFVKEYLLSNYKLDLPAFIPVNADGSLAITFSIAKKQAASTSLAPLQSSRPIESSFKRPLSPYQLELNPNYTFENFIEGPANQFVKSAALGVSKRPGQTYNPLFIHGGVGLGKTHTLHSIGNHIRKHSKKLRVQCITTEQFINDLVDNLKNKKVDKMKKFYRQEVDVLLVDDIQFLQNRLNFEEEFCNTFEALIHQKKQIVITSDKPPSQLQLSERIIARMEWGLVTQMGVPEVETRVAILQHKAQAKGVDLPQAVAFFIAEHISHNVRQLEGAVNKLSAHSKLLNVPITEEFVEHALHEMFHSVPREKVTVEQILKAVSSVFDVKISQIRSSQRTKAIALSRQVAMYLACKLINDSLQMLAASFGKTHSTLLHAKKAIEKKATESVSLKKQITQCERALSC